MNASDHIIVIGREFGCGARELGEALAQRLSIPYYDKELLSRAAESFGVRSEVFSNADECRPSLLKSFASMFFAEAGQYSTSSAMSPHSLYEAQSEVIREICAKGPCVIVGRTADYIAREMPHMVSIFLHAPAAHRAGKIVARGDADSIEKALAMAAKHDAARAQYYNYYTGRKWGNANNYDLCLDSSQLPLEACVDLIVAWLEHRQ